MKVLYEVIQKPCLTEKSNLLQEVENTVTFRVDPRANKIEIKKAVEELFDVKVRNVRITPVKGKKRRVGLKSLGKTSDWKKAYVSLSEGKINFLEEL